MGQSWTKFPLLPVPLPNQVWKSVGIELRAEICAFAETLWYLASGLPVLGIGIVEAIVAAQWALCRPEESDV